MLNFWVTIYCLNIDQLVLGSDFLFTGIVEEIGYITHLNKNNSGAKIKIEAKKTLMGLKIGDSVAVNGVCLTVVQIEDKAFVVDVMNETIKRSSMKLLHVGSMVNLERAMLAGGRFDGHIVTGHIDGIGTISEKRNDGIAVWYTIKTSQDILKYVVEKGSVCLDGVSLTVAEVDGRSFKVSIIPHTLTATTLSNFDVGMAVNIENDIISKYVEKFLNTDCNKSSLTKEKLIESGFFN